ncbi:MAG: acetate kinase [Clostridiales bacterium]|nr:MAG: acetate kinase [Clostridiales bacterium]
MKILVINSGSSSLKYQLIDMANDHVIAKGICEKIGIGGFHKHFSAGKGEFKTEMEIKTHSDAAQIVIDTLTKGDYAVISSIDEISAVGHRIVQGGDLFSGPELVTEEVIEKIEGLQILAPLHAYPNAAGIRSCKAVMPEIPQVVVFDTAFHQTMPKYAYMYGLPMEYYEKYRIRRYGFHGTSHKYISQKAAEWLGKDIKDLRLVTLHLGNGSSLCAIKNGECIDTSMGLTPLEGPMMGTRCGSIDPAAVAVIMEKEGLTGSEMNDIMNKKSGIMAISGVSSDFRDVNDAADAGNENAALALHMFAYQCKKILAGYVAAMGGVDAIVFTAGVGENRPETRQYITDGLEFLGIKIDLDKNNVMGKDVDITAEGATVKTLILTTNEELMIAKETLELIKK